MKNFLLLLASCFAFLPCFGQITISAPASVTSGTTFTITASGEASSKYVASMSLFPTPPTTTDPANQYVVVDALALAGHPYETSGQPTKFSTKITITSSSDVIVTFNVRCLIRTPSSQTNQDQTITITVKPVVTTYYNVAKSGVFTRNNCGPGTVGSNVTYTIAANTYSASSQAAADQLAINAVNAGGQAYANANGQCLIVYNSAEQTGTFTKNDCLTGGTPSAPLSYTIQAGAYTSTISQQHADDIAQSHLALDGQAYANANGTCSYPPKITGPVKASLGVEYDYFVENTSGGDTFEWIIPSNFASIESGQGTKHISILINYDISNPPKVFTIKVKITSSTGVEKIVNYSITAIRGRG